MKSDFKFYVKILATVVKMFTEIIKNNETPGQNPLYIFSSTSKSGEQGTRDTKLKYYKAILNYNLPSNYRMGEGEYMGMEVIALQKLK